MMAGRSSLYKPYRALGLVCDGATADTPATTHQLGTATFVTTPTAGGTLVHLYDVELQLKRVSTPFPAEWTGYSLRMTRLAAKGNLTFVGLGSAIGVMREMKCERLLTAHDATLSVLSCTAGLLFSGCEQGRLIVWKDVEVWRDIAMPEGFVPVWICHPVSYVNKVVVVGRDGRWLILNVASCKVLYVSDVFCGRRVSAVCASPLPDVVAFGMDDGEIVLHNVRYDESVLKFEQGMDDKFGVSALSFRSDATLLVSGSTRGGVFLWDLPNKRLLAECQVHEGAVGMAHFLQGEAALITAGTSDNSVKVHVFDAANDNLRLLRAREGHRLPPTVARFCGNDGAMLLSAGLDCELRMVSVVREARNQEFAQKVDRRGVKAKRRMRREGAVELGGRGEVKRLPKVVDVACCELRQRDSEFANVVTVHEGLKEAYTWRMQDGTKFAHVLIPPAGPVKVQLKGTGKKRKREKGVVEDGTARCCVVSPCGNFAVVGCVDGRLHMYNLQSGLHQGVYADERLGGIGWGKAHERGVGCACADGVGEILVSGGVGERVVKVWDLYAREMKGEIEAEGNVVKMVWSKRSELLAVVCEDFGVYVYDGSTRKLARKFMGHGGNIADICFGEDGRRLITASLDGQIRTWDLPSGRCLDVLRCSNAPTSVDLGGGYLATTHVNELGICLWVDKSNFGGDAEGSEGEDTDTIAVDESSDEEMEDVERVEVKQVEKDDKAEKDKSMDPQPMWNNVATLSSKPLAQWTMLSNLQAIKERNKPTEPVKKPESAPFFLPTVQGLNFEFDVREEQEEESGEQQGKKGKRKRKKKGRGMSDEEDWANSRFGRLVATEQHGRAALLLRTLDASGVDLEIRTLDGEKARKNAAKFFVERLRMPQEYELSQAHLGVFLSAHGRELAADEGGVDILREVLEAQRTAWEGVRERVESVLTLSAYFSGQV